MRHICAYMRGQSQLGPNDAVLVASDRAHVHVNARLATCSMYAVNACQSQGNSNLKIKCWICMHAGALDGDLDGYGSFSTDDLLPTSALPMGDLPTLPELSSLMSASPGSSSMPMPGLSESDTPTLNFPPSTMGSAAFDSLPATVGMLGGTFEGLGGRQDGRGYASGSSSSGVFNFGNDFIPDDMLISGASVNNKRA